MISYRFVNKISTFFQEIFIMEFDANKLNELRELVSQCKSKEELDKTFLFRAFLKDYIEVKKHLFDNEIAMSMCEISLGICHRSCIQGLTYKKAFHNQFKIIGEEYIKNLKLLSELSGIQPSFEESYELYKKEAANEE